MKATKGGHMSKVIRTITLDAWLDRAINAIMVEKNWSRSLLISQALIPFIEQNLKVGLSRPDSDQQPSA